MEEMPRDFKGVWIPKQIYLDERLSALDKIILIEINSLDSGDGCFASNEYLATFCQCSESKVSKAIAKLIEIGYLEIVKFDGRKRFLRGCLVKNAKLAKSASLPSKKCQADWQKMLHNNIDNNIANKTNNNKLLLEPTAPERGNLQINECFKKWEELFGYKQKDSRSNRFAAYNMIRAKGKGEEWLMKTMTLLFEAQKDKYAGNYILGISNFADLQQRYDAVWKWGSTRYARSQEAEESIDI